MKQGLLSFNEATVCNTWFKKKDIHKTKTLKHPKSKKWHCIDYVIAKSTCLDVSVMCGVGCNSDQQLLGAKFVVGRKSYFRRNQSK